MVTWLNKLIKSPSSSGNQIPQRILVTGVGKTGSTALFHAILNSLPPETVSLFEPETSGESLPEDIKPPVLVKSFVHYSGHFDFFEKKILIIRDLRDQLISALLYKPYNLLLKSTGPEQEADATDKVNRFMELLRQKEASPAEVTVKQLYDIIPVGTTLRINNIINYAKNHPEAFIMKYEDFISNNLDKLNEYLGFDISGSVVVPKKYERVTRTKSSGNWRSWFTPSDIEYFRPELLEYMKLFGYKDEWELEKEPGLDPQTGSLYLEKLLKEARSIKLKEKEN
jgi:hypothetical protein